jgi:hypothetical protein
MPAINYWFAGMARSYIIACLLYLAFPFPRREKGLLPSTRGGGTEGGGHSNIHKLFCLSMLLNSGEAPI